MIAWDSPVETVLGDATGKRKRIVEGLGLRTVGDHLTAIAFAAQRPCEGLGDGHIVLGQ